MEQNEEHPVLEFIGALVALAFWGAVLFGCSSLTWYLAHQIPSWWQFGIAGGIGTVAYRGFKSQAQKRRRRAKTDAATRQLAETIVAKATSSARQDMPLRVKRLG